MKTLGGYLKVTRGAALRRLLPVAVGLMLTAAPLHAAQPKWEQTKTEHQDAKTVVKETDIEIRTGKGIIVVNSSKPVQIKVYTILGQLVSRENLPAGTSQLSVQAHGVYIIKSGRADMQGGALTIKMRLTINQILNTK